MYILFQFFFARLTDELLVFIIIVLPIYRATQWSFHLANPPSGTQTVPIKGNGHVIFVFMCIAAIYPFFLSVPWALTTSTSNPTQRLIFSRTSKPNRVQEFSWPVTFWGIRGMAHDPSGSLDLKFGKTTEDAWGTARGQDRSRCGAWP